MAPVPEISPSRLFLTKVVAGRIVISVLSLNVSFIAFTDTTIFPTPIAKGATIENVTFFSLFAGITQSCFAGPLIDNDPVTFTSALAFAGLFVVFVSVTGMTSESPGDRKRGIDGLITIGSATFMCLSLLPNEPAL